MSERKFKFVSPGVFVKEIDNSQLPKTAEEIGPLIIGRSQRGPSMRPVTVDSFSDFIEVFGEPHPGGKGGDVWRDGNFTAPLYAPYAAQSWFANGSPVTFVRLLGEQHSNATADGEAGWETSATPATTVLANGGAYGLFVVASGTVADHGNAALAAVFYMDEGAIRLTGSNASGSTVGASGTDTGAAALVQSIGANFEFKAVISDADGTDLVTSAFNFNENSDKHIRKVFNTNPILTNGTLTTAANLKTYWLGDSFERFLDDTVSGGDTAGDCYGFIMALATGSVSAADFRMSAQAARTGWFFSQDLSTNYAAYNPESMTKLFYFAALDSGEWANRNIKVSIEDIAAPANLETGYGTFSVVVRQATDNDGKVVVLERFSGCTLEPTSPDYLAKKVGDMFTTWNSTTRRYAEYGSFVNNSKYIRVVMNQDVDAGATEPSLLPFGVYGPLQYKDATITSGSRNLGGGLMVLGSGSIPLSRDLNVENGAIATNIAGFTCSIKFPEIPLRVSSSDGNFASPTDAYWGADMTKAGSTRFSKECIDVLRAKPADVDSFSAGTYTQHSWIFSLDDVRVNANDSNSATFVSGSRVAGSSYTATGSGTWQTVLTQGYDKFTSPVFGGFDGFDITEKEPFNNADITSATETTHYAYNSIRKAIDACRDPEVVEFNKALIPGLTNASLTQYLIDTCEDRADALAIIDLSDDYVPNTENTSAESSRISTVATLTSTLRDRGINSSYGCAYTSWAQIKDSINNGIVWVPPSVVVLGAMSYSQRVSEKWYAPAGFNRGGLTENNIGFPVLSVRRRLYKDDRDILQSYRVNPIAKFPSEGIVIFGQKTLQVTPSALDRINVRLLMIEVKKVISRIASRLLFEPNVQQTWNNFKGQVNPYLKDVKIKHGLADFKVILDETTTTPDLIDRNIMYAKIMLKPTRSVEYIAIDFNIANTGASFDD